MKDIVEMLIDFSNTHNLWEQSKIAGTKSLNDYFINEKAEAEKLLPGHSIHEITFSKKSQVLTFYEFEASTFIISTKYALYSELKGPNIEIGYYVLDVDSNGVPVDDWLVLD